MADSLDYCVRLASPNVRYPLPTHGVAQWRWRKAAVAVRLPDVPKDHIVTASFSSLSAPASCAFRLEAGGKHFETAYFGHRTRRRERVRAGGVAVPVDYFHVERDLTAPTLSLLCRAPRPKDYLLVVSVRPREVQPPEAAPADVAPLDAPPLSQMTLPEDIRLSACSPTATAMALNIAESAFEPFVATARHHATGLYGAWPQNIWAAARQGVHGGVELASDWSLAEQVLSQGLPLVASIRFGPGELAGSPRPQTGGHLVLLRGIDQGQVVVNDPAAPPPNVERRYDAAEFATAWIKRRGVAYVFAERAAGV